MSDKCTARRRVAALAHGVIAAFLVACCATANAQDDQPKTVCAVMESLPAYGNRVVTVVGEFESGEDVFFLAGRDCKKRFETKGFLWPAAIQLRDPGTPQDRKIMIEFTDALRRAKKKNRGARGCLVITGRLEVRSDYEVVRGADGTLRGRGFGHMSAYPAQLTMQSVKILSLRPYSGIACACCN